MSWFIFALLAAIFLSASTLVEKRSLERIHTIDLSVALAFTNLVLSLPFLFFVDISKITRDSTVVIFGSAALAAAAFYLVAKGMRHLEISLVAPLLALAPGTTGALGFFVLGEHLSTIHIAGIACMIIGSYVLTLEPHRNLLYPFKTFAQSKYIHFILLSLLFYSAGATLDRAILSDFGVPIANYMFFAHFFIALLYIPVILVLRRDVGDIKSTFRIEGGNILILSVLTITYRFFQMQALSLMFVGLVSAIKRSSSFFTTLVGGELFHEKNLGRKLAASAIIIAGTILIVL